MSKRYKIVTVSELEKMLKEKKLFESVDFTFDSELEEEPTGWYGVKLIDLFDESKGLLAMGCYGGGATIVKDIGAEGISIEGLLREMLNELSETNSPVDVVCVDLLSCNGMSFCEE